MCIRYLYVAVLVLLAALLQGCPGTLFSLTVEVVDEETGFSVEGAAVTLSGVETGDVTVTEPVSGAYLFLAILDREVEVTVRADGYLEATRAVVSSRPGEAIELTVELEPVVPLVDCTENLLADGGFELGNSGGAWVETSTSFANPIVCCRPAPGTGALSGEWWIWFGGYSEGDTEGSATQTLTIPSGAGAALQFYLEIPEAEVAGEMAVLIDGTEVFTATHEDVSGYARYRRVNVSLGAIADGGEHTLEFRSSTVAGGLTSFFVDDICMVVE